MKLNGLREYLSIAPFDEIELPDFAVVIGLNGVGKSQFLTAISNGSIDCDGSSKDSAASVRLLVSGQSSQHDDHHDDHLFSRLMSYPLPAIDPTVAAREFHRKREHLYHQLLDELNSLGIVMPAGAKISELIRSGYRHPKDSDQPSSYISNHEDRALFALTANEEISIKYEKAIFSIPEVALILRASQERNPNISTRFYLLHATLPMLAGIVGGEAEPVFEANIARYFRIYRDRVYRNDVAAARALRVAEITRGNIGDNPDVLSEIDFIRAYGDPPWELLSETMLATGLPYRAEPPNWEGSTTVTFLLRHTENGTLITYNELSSGERILLDLALSVFRTESTYSIVRTPRIILMDELDASLHPLNVKKWITALQSLVKKLGLRCIVTTHSPTTVALAPENAIFEMRADDRVPRHIDKQAGIDMLTAGVPTLAVDYDARQLIFTESGIDARHYSKLYDYIRPMLALTKSLSFIGSDRKGNHAFVRDMVAKMREHGNRAVFGIIDWDRERLPSTYVFVVGQNTHYTKENLFLDPLLVGLYLLKQRKLTLDFETDYISLDRKDNVAMQAIADAVASRLEFPNTAPRGVGSSSFYSGISVNVPVACRVYKGHQLADIFKKAHPALGKRDEEELVTLIIEHVLSENPELCPSPVAEVLIKIARIG